jgi:galactose mutarotase-like enzyme
MIRQPFFALSILMLCSVRQSFSEDQSEFRIENENLRLVVSSQGAEPQSLYGVRSGLEYLWQGDPQFWSGRSPILFPIMGRVKEGKYSWRGKTYSISIPHGFAKDLPFELELREAARLRFLLKSSEEKKKQYPFDFQFRVEYVLEGASLDIRFRVDNTGSQPMPFAWGAHPGFRVPLAAAEKFEEFRSELDAKESPERLLLDVVFMYEKKAPFVLKNGRSLPLQRKIFDDEAIILQNIRNRTIFLVGPDDRRHWSLEFGDFDFLACWQPEKSEAPFVSLEPWTGLPDPSDKTISELDEKIGMKTVPPGGFAEAKLTFTLLQTSN